FQEPKNEELAKWERWVVGEIEGHRLVLVSDKHYLDYLFNTNAVKHRTLYRSASNDEVVPYFLPLSGRNSAQLDQEVNRLYVCVVFNMCRSSQFFFSTE